MLSLYTSTDAVRAVFGVSARELKDEVLGLQFYYDILLSELRRVSPNVTSSFVTVSNTDPRTAAQEDFLIAVRTFATYAVAKAVGPAIRKLAPKAIEDGKARLERFDDPYKEALKSVEAEYGRWRENLQAAMNLINVSTETATPRTFFASAPAGSNPITGE